MPPRRFRRVLQAEAAVMVLVLAAAGVLAASPPPDRAVQEGGGVEPVFELDQSTRTTHVVLQVRPNPPAVGLQRVSVLLHPLTADPLPNGTQVALKFQGPGEPEPDTLVTPRKVGPGEWSTEEEVFLTAPGTWKVHVLVQRPDEYRKLVFEVPVAAPGQPGAVPSDATEK